LRIRAFTRGPVLFFWGLRVTGNNLYASRYDLRDFQSYASGNFSLFTYQFHAECAGRISKAGDTPIVLGSVKIVLQCCLSLVAWIPDFHVTRVSNEQLSRRAIVEVKMN